MLYVIVGLTTDGMRIPLNNTKDFNQLQPMIQNWYMGYEKVEVYLVNFDTRTVTKIAEK